MLFEIGVDTMTTTSRPKSPSMSELASSGRGAGSRPRSMGTVVSQRNQIGSFNVLYSYSEHHFLEAAKYCVVNSI